MSYKITDTIIVDNNKNISSIGTALFSGPVIIGGGTSTGTASQLLQVTGTNGAYIGGNLGIGSTNPTSKLWVSGDIYGAGIVTAYVLKASKDPGSGIGTDFTNSLFGNGWRVNAPGSTTYYKLATLPAGGGGSTFDHLVINGVLGAWTNGNQTPFEITFSNRGAFDYRYISYGSVRSDVRIIGISTNSNVEIWAQHQVSQFTKLVYNIANSIQAIVVSNPTSTTTAPTGTTVFDSSTATPRFIINESDNVGIGTTNPTSKLTVNGDGRFTGVVTATTFIGALTGTATSLGGGLAGNIVYQSAANTTAFLANGGSGTVLQSNGVGNAPTWVTAAPSGAVSGITVRDSNSNIVGTSGSVTQLTFSTGFGVTGTTGAAGIATITLSSNIVGTSLSISGISTFANGPVIVGSATSTGTESQRLQVDGGAYVSGNLGIGTTNPTSLLDVRGDASIGNRFSYVDAPGDLFSFPGTENNITFPGASYEIVTVGCTTDVAGSLNNKYFTIYGPVGFNTDVAGIVTSINTTLTEQNVVVWFNVAGAGSTPAVAGAGRTVGVAITTGASNISIGNTIVTTMSDDAGFTVGSSGDGTVVFVAKTPDTFSDPNAGTSGFAVTTTSNGSGSLSGTIKWQGGVLAPNGKIYGIPRDSTSVLVIDPATNTTSTFGSLSGSAKWIGGVLAPNGKIYGIPHNSTSVLVIDPATNTTSTFGSLSGTIKWVGGVLAPNGKIYGIPYNSTSVLVIDPATNTTSTFGSLSGSTKWIGGVLAPNGKIYGIPRDSTSVLVIDPATNTTSTFGSLSGTVKWIGGVLAPNGKIYGIPQNSTSVLVIDPATNTTSTFGSLSGTSKWYGGVLAPNGKIYGIPYNSTSVLVIDPATNTTSTFGSLSGTVKWVGGVLAPNGKIYGIPYNSTSVLSIGGGSAAIPDWYLSAYQNKF